MDSKIRVNLDSLSEFGDDLAEIGYALCYYNEKCAILSFNGAELKVMVPMVGLK